MCKCLRNSRSITFNTTIEWVATYIFYGISYHSMDFFHHRLSPFPKLPLAETLRFSSIAKDLPEFRHLFRKSVCYALGLPTHGNCVEVEGGGLNMVERFFCGCAEWGNFDPYLHRCLYTTSIEHSCAEYK